MFLGKLKQSEAIRFFLTLDAAATGTPTVTIEKQGVQILAPASMSAGLSSLEWYYDYTTGAAATVGAYQIRYTAVIDAVTRYAFDHYDQTVYETDDVKAETALILSDTNAILVDTGTTLPATLTTIEGKLDTVDTVVDGIAVQTGDIASVKAQTDLLTFDGDNDAVIVTIKQGVWGPIT